MAERDLCGRFVPNGHGGAPQGWLQSGLPPAGQTQRDPAVAMTTAAPAGARPQLGAWSWQPQARGVWLRSPDWTRGQCLWSTRHALTPWAALPLRVRSSGVRTRPAGPWAGPRFPASTNARVLLWACTSRPVTDVVRALDLLRCLEKGVLAMPSSTVRLARCRRPAASVAGMTRLLPKVDGKASV